MGVRSVVTAAGAAAPVHGDQREGSQRLDPVQPHAWRTCTY